ncbi:hypothetical protein CHS0354_017275 [Potamilus streckersoni]|uniref:F5/8 type C domain-containing protein n=1 Tax=Potamilus streckersoni TaxID=2493646 RepID=A0AAE0VUQ0_9BIVA|nr:hypothetical protein CHS0354_017275 [Potamilus streckersoni]
MLSSMVSACSECRICSQHLVSGPQGVADDQLSASSEWDPLHGPRWARLNTVFVSRSHIGGWAAKVNDRYQYIQVKFNRVSIVHGIVTQGRSVVNDTCKQYVKSFKVFHSMDGRSWTPVKERNGEDKVFRGNSDQETIETNYFPCPVLANFIRINPQTWNEHITLRFDVLGHHKYSDPKRSHLEENTWRKGIEWSSEFLDGLKTKLENYVPIKEALDCDVSFPEVNILFLGPTGGGKSSFFNTVHSAFRGKIFNQALSGRAPTSMTTKFTRYTVLSSSTVEPMRFKLCDTRGLEPSHTMTNDNMRLMLEGHLPDIFMFDPGVTIASDLPGFVKSPYIHDRIHSVVFFLDATSVDAMHSMIPEVVQNIKSLQSAIYNHNIPIFIILTKVDCLCAHVREDVQNVFRCPLVEQSVNKVAEEFGLRRNAVFPMKNLENEGEIDDNVSILALSHLKTILENVDASLFNRLSEIKEVYGHKKLNVF